MMNNTNDRGGVSFRTVFLIAILVAVLGVSGYLFYRWQTLSTYKGKVDKITTSGKVQIADNNRTFASFKGDPESTFKFQPEFVKAQNSMAAVAKDLKSVQTPGTSVNYHRDLIKFYDSSAKFYGDLGEFAGYITARNSILDRLASSSETFNQQVSAATDDPTVVLSARDMKTLSDDAFKRLANLKKKSLANYSNRPLNDELTVVTDALDLIEAGINARDMAKIRQGGVALQAAFARNWREQALVGDAKALKTFSVRQTELRDLQVKATMERSAL